MSNSGNEAFVPAVSPFLKGEPMLLLLGPEGDFREEARLSASAIGSAEWSGAIGADSAASFDAGSFDAVVAIEGLGNDLQFWTTTLEVFRVLKPSGIFCFWATLGGFLEQPSGKGWGFYPDAGEALANWLHRNGLPCVLSESRVLLDERDQSLKLSCVLRKCERVEDKPRLSAVQVQDLEALMRVDTTKALKRASVVPSIARRRLRDQSRENASLRRALEQKERRVRELTVELAATNNEKRALKKSVSWKITKPLRKITLLTDYGTLKKTKLIRRASKLTKSVYVRNYRIFSVSKRYRKLQIQRNIKFGLDEAFNNNWKAALNNWLVALELYGMKIPSSNDANFLRYAVKLAKIFLDIDGYREKIARYRDVRGRRKSEQGESPKIAVCSAILGGYDTLKLPLHLDDGVDYILYTDRSVDDTGLFEVRPVEYFDTDVTRASRYIKTHPHTLLSDYDIAIWIDANVAVLSSLRPLIDAFLASGRCVGGIPHPVRSSIYTEAAVCVELGKDLPEIIENQVEHYQAQGFDATNMVEANVLFFDLRDRRAHIFLNTWWNEIDRYSKRDQLSFNYALQAVGLDWYRLMQHPQNTRNYSGFALLKHDSGDGIPERLNTAVSRGAADPYGGVRYSKVRESRTSQKWKYSVDLIIRIHDDLADIEAFLESVLRASGGAEQRFILIDDASTSKSRAYLESFISRETNSLLHRFESACGQVLAENAGIALSTADMIILLDGNTEVHQGWVEKILDAMFSHPYIGVVSPLSNASPHQFFPMFSRTEIASGATEQTRPATVAQINAMCEQLALADVRPWVPVADGPCLGISRAAIETIRALDNQFFPGGFCARADLCFRAAEAGFGIVLADHTYVAHQGWEHERRLNVNESQQQAEWNQLKKLHGSERVSRAIHSMRQHPLLNEIRAALRDIGEVPPENFLD